MAKVTSKLQVTIPKAIATEYGIEPGDEIDFQSAGPQIRVVPRKAARRARLSLAERLRLFDESMQRQRERDKLMKLPAEPPTDRGWTREELYTRGDAD
jgi:AbrB family looped-hinge helix DNA binding protein